MTTALRPSEVARSLGVSRFTVYDLIHRGELPAVRVGHQFRIDAAAVAAYRAAGRGAAPSGDLVLRSGDRRTVLALPADVAALPEVTTDAVVGGPSGLRRHRYRGVLLFALLADAGLAPADDVLASGHCGALVQSYVVARGRDGAAAVFGLAEIAPEYGRSPVLVAWERDGAPIDGLQLVAPNDGLAGRAIRGLESITVASVEDA